MMVPDNWGALLEPGLRKIFDQHKRDLPDYMAQLFNVETSSKAQETSQGVGSLGIMDEWEKTNKRVSYEDIDPGFKPTYIHKKYSKGIQIERELVDDDQYNEIKKRVKRLSRVVYYTRQVHGLSVFNNAFNGAFKGPDGQPLCSNAHPLSPESTATQSNIGTEDLTAPAIENARTRMMEWKDDKGNPIDIIPDTILVPPALRKAALIIADSDKEPDISDNNVNVWKGSLNVIECSFLLDPKAWFLIDGQRMKDFLNWYDRQKPNFQYQEEFDTEVAKYKTVGRWSYGWDDWTWVYGANPA